MPVTEKRKKEAATTVGHDKREKGKQETAIAPSHSGLGTPYIYIYIMTDMSTSRTPPYCHSVLAVKARRPSFLRPWRKTSLSSILHLEERSACTHQHAYVLPQRATSPPPSHLVIRRWPLSQDRPLRLSANTKYTFTYPPIQLNRYPLSGGAEGERRHVREPFIHRTPAAPRLTAEGKKGRRRDGTTSYPSPSIVLTDTPAHPLLPSHIFKSNRPKERERGI